MNNSNVLNKSFLIAILLFVLMYGYFVYKIHLSKDSNLWDFRTYYYAVKVYEKGDNPYILENLKKESNNRVEFNFIYPIYTLLFFKIFTLWNYNVAFDIYLFLKFFLIIFLFILWSGYFLKKQNSLFLLLFCVLAIENTIFADFATGNVSIFEQFFLWIAFYFFMEKRYKFFVFFLILASLFKFVFLFFLFMLFFTDEKNKIIYFISGIFIIALLTFFSFILKPEFVKSYLTNIIFLDERGYINPAIFPMLKDLFEIFVRKFKNNNLIQISYIIYFIYFVILSIISIRLIKKIKHVGADEWEKNRLFLFFMICFYTVISPRFKEYSYIIMLLPAAFIILKNNMDFTKYLLFFIFILSKEMFAPDINKIYQKFIWPYYQYWLSFMCFFLYVIYIIFNARKNK